MSSVESRTPSRRNWCRATPDRPRKAREVRPRKAVDVEEKTGYCTITLVQLCPLSGLHSSPCLKSYWRSRAGFPTLTKASSLCACTRVSPAVCACVAMPRLVAGELARVSPLGNPRELAIHYTIYIIRPEGHKENFCKKFFFVTTPHPSLLLLHLGVSLSEYIHGSIYMPCHLGTLWFPSAPVSYSG